MRKLGKNLGIGMLELDFGYCDVGNGKGLVFSEVDVVI